jgi:predicted metalloprotease
MTPGQRHAPGARAGVKRPMRYSDDDRESSNIEDRRGQRGPMFRFPSGMGRGRGVRIPVGGKGGVSLGTILIIGIVLMVLGINPLELLTGGGGNYPQVPQMPRSEPSVGRDVAGRGSPSDIPGLPGGRTLQSDSDDMKRFVALVLADTEDVWNDVFKSIGRNYQEPSMVLFTDATRTGCGVGVAAMGPFYCPLDRKIYIDLSFYDQLRRRFNAPGDFAQAYVIAHEVGHHVQKLLGIADKVQDLKSGMDERSANALQVRMELQADCLAGVWANRNEQLRNRLEPGDVKEGLNAASQIGDDMMQRRMQGRVVPDAFTHGSSEQRVRWFRAGLESGDMGSCDTFNSSSL